MFLTSSKVMWWRAPPSLHVMAGLVPAIHVFLSRGTKNVDARDKPGHDERVRRDDVDSVHAGKKPAQPESRQPRPHRLVADTHVPRADHGIRASDQIVDRQEPDAAVAHRNAAVGGIVAVVAQHE